MEKTIVIDGKEVKFKATANTPRLYRLKFRRDMIQDMAKLAEQQKNGKILPGCWMVCGTEDFGYGLCKRACERLSDMELDITWLEDYGEHNFAMWDRYIEPFFDWLGLQKGGVR